MNQKADFMQKDDLACCLSDGAVLMGDNQVARTES